MKDSVWLVLSNINQRDKFARNRGLHFSLERFPASAFVLSAWSTVGKERMVRERPCAVLASHFDHVRRQTFESNNNFPRLMDHFDQRQSAKNFHAQTSQPFFQSLNPVETRITLGMKKLMEILGNDATIPEFWSTVVHNSPRRVKSTIKLRITV